MQSTSKEEFLERDCLKQKGADSEVRLMNALMVAF